MKFVIDEFGHLKLDYNTYQALTDKEKSVVKANFEYEGGSWILKPDATIEPEIDDRELAEMRIQRGIRRGKTKEEIIADGIHPFVFEKIMEG